MPPGVSRFEQLIAAADAEGDYRVLLAVALLGAAVFVFVSRSPVVTQAEIAGVTPDLARGETVFWAAGCASCHAADGAQGDAKLVLSGGHRLVTPFGTFVAPNISQDEEHGIGGWSGPRSCPR